MVTYIMTSQEWTSLTSGLIGAVLGFVGALLITWWNNRSRRKAAGRALIAEMFINADRALSAESTDVTHEFFDFVWREQLPLISQLIRWADLKKVVTAYDSSARMFENAHEILERHRFIDENIRPTSGLLEARQHELNKIHSGFQSVAAEWLIAMRTLRKAGSRWRDRRELDADLRKLETRLAAKQ